MTTQDYKNAAIKLQKHRIDFLVHNINGDCAAYNIGGTNKTPNLCRSIPGIHKQFPDGTKVHWVGVNYEEGLLTMDMLVKPVITPTHIVVEIKQSSNI